MGYQDDTPASIILHIFQMLKGPDEVDAKEVGISEILFK